MESRRALGLLIAVIASILVILAGRSCAKSIDNENQKSKKSAVPPVERLTGQVATAVLATDEAPQVPQTPQQPDNLQVEDPTVSPEADPEISDIPTTTKSQLDKFWDSETPSYLDPYGFLDDGGYSPPESVHIEIN